MSFTKSTYNRQGVASVCNANFGNVSISDILSEEIVIVSFEYNSHTPILFTKMAARIKPEIFNVSISDATQASAAAPIYFDPM